MINMWCSRCGSLLGQAPDQKVAAAVQREHMQNCELDP